MLLCDLGLSAESIDKEAMFKKLEGKTKEEIARMTAEVKFEALFLEAQIISYKVQKLYVLMNTCEIEMLLANAKDSKVLKDNFKKLESQETAMIKDLYEKSKTNETVILGLTLAKKDLVKKKIQSYPNLDKEYVFESEFIVLKSKESK